MKNRRVFMTMIMAMLFIFSITGIAYGNGISFYTPRPQGNIMITRPSIIWQIILNGNTVESIDMKLDGNKVEAKYNHGIEAVEYIPLEPLKPGPHTVDLTVGIKGWAKPLSRSWQFTVSEQGVDLLAPPSPEQKEALDYANQYRNLFQLNPFQGDAALNAAAAAHANYMATHQEASHYESAKQKGFTGASPGDRAGSFGYIGGYISENVSAGQRDYKEAINGLVDAPYHRLTWLNPFFTDMGYSKKERYYAFLFGGKKTVEDQLVVYPLDNQKGVPIAWDGVETPDPLRNHKKKGPVGYPVTLSYFSGKPMGKFTVDKAILSNSQGKTVEVFLNTPQTDEHLQESILLIPVSPLEPGEKYTASVKGSVVFEDKTEKKIEKTWTFETAVFADMRNHWAKEDVLTLGSQKVVTPKYGIEFKPDEKITRAEFAEFVVNALGISTREYEGILKDVPKDANKALHVEAAYRAGIVKGMGDGNFAPNRQITREEIAIMIIRAYEKKGNMEKIKQLSPLSFADKEEISGWALNDVKAAVQLGMMRGRLNNQFAPKDYATRAEAAVMLKRFLESI
ncbi:CAP and S-layer homology domain-containing protein [Thermotalea metallivorans]|uniref:Endoglucanase n=1 Tax=Thermotalea metallivorans TaxID=520762 RepID=A0A140L515_9FIRM|nr:S-layer homology domain-containing protein [Thermotalea metallivorans]KXG75640.1 Endoglucanase [Thermotalea metallivorans]